MAGRVALDSSKVPLINTGTKSLPRVRIDVGLFTPTLDSSRDATNSKLCMSAGKYGCCCT